VNVVSALNVTLTPAGFLYYHGGKGAHVVVWDSSGACDLVQESGHNTLGNPIIVGRGNIYNTTGSKTVRFYTDDKMTVLQFQSQVNKVTAIDETTNVSNKLQRFWATGQNCSGNLDQTFLNRAKDELREINFSNSGFQGITGGWISSLHVGSYKPFRFLRYMYYNNNGIPSADLDALFNEMVDHMNIATGWGQTRVYPQAGGGVLTGASAAAQTALTNLFWAFP
jgi:hypothetical protein